MHYSLSLPIGSPWPIVSIGACAPEPATAFPAENDPRWRSLVSRLESLRERGRRSVRIVDVNCGNGALLVQVAKLARSLDFLAIECCGIDCEQKAIEEARQRALRLVDSAIGLSFEVGEPLAQLAAEAEFPADIVLYEASPHHGLQLREAVRRAGDLALRTNPSPWRLCA